MHGTILSAAVAASLVAGAAHAEAAHAETVKLGLTRTATDIGLYVADKRGYFKKEGLDVQFVTFQSAAMMVVPMSSGDLQVIAGSPSAGLYNAIGRGLDIRLVVSKVSTPAGRTSQTLVVRKDLYDSGKVRRIADLKGMKVANAAPGTASLASLYRMLGTAHMGLHDVDIVYLAFPQMVVGLRNKAVAAALPAEPATMAAVKGGLAVPLMRDDEAYPDHQIANLFFSGRFMKEHPQSARKFLRAFLHGVRDHNDALDDRGMFKGEKGEAIIRILNEYTSVKDPAFFRSFALAYCDPDGTVNVESLKADFAIFSKEGLIKGNATPEKLIDLSALGDVLKDIGRYRKAD